MSATSVVQVKDCGVHNGFVTVEGCVVCDVAALRARVKELEADLRTGIELWDGKWHGDEFWRRRANWLNSVCAKLRDADALHRPTPSQERP